MLQIDTADINKRPSVIDTLNDVVALPLSYQIIKNDFSYYKKSKI